MEKRIVLQDGEAELIRGYFAAIDRAKRDLTVAVGMIFSAGDITAAVVEGIEGNELILTIPS